MQLVGGSGAALNTVDFGGRVPVLTRCHWPTGVAGATALTDGTIEWAGSQCYHKALFACSSLVVVYAMSGAYEANAGAITTSDVPGTVTVASALWTGGSGAVPPGAGTSHDFLWAGAGSVAMTDKQIAVSDPLTLSLAQDEVVYSRHTISVPAGSGGKWPLAVIGAGLTLALNDGEVTGTGTPGTDYLHAGTIAATNQGNKGWRPLAVLGIPS